mmetsp:Transcript_99612/g.281101  ORF Transcript_99612/g.281101 Transcript_99612/m.281101 type:complete len:293 (+) Transcript_99612:410-1288(+)
MHDVPINHEGESPRLFRRHLLDQFTHVVVPEARVAASRRGGRPIEPGQGLVLARVTFLVYLCLVRITEELADGLHSGDAASGWKLFDLLFLHFFLNRLEKLGSGGLLFFFVLGLLALLLFVPPPLQLLLLLALLLFPALPLLFLLATPLLLGFLLRLLPGLFLSLLFLLFLLLLFAPLLLDFFLLLLSVGRIFLLFLLAITQAVLAVTFPLALVALVLTVGCVALHKFSFFAIAGLRHHLRVPELALVGTYPFIFVSLEFTDAVLVFLLDVALAVAHAALSVAFPTTLPVVP